MMTSYLASLFIVDTSKSITKDHLAHLPYLIRLGFAAFGLEIQDLLDPFLEKI